MRGKSIGALEKLGGFRLPTTNGATILAEAAFPTNSTQQYRIE
jgi:hypothetical protein